MEQNNKEQKEKKPTVHTQEEACPLCKISEETVERLKKAQEKEPSKFKEK